MTALTRTLLVAVALSTLCEAQEITIESKFPGGSGEVERIDAGEKLVVLHPTNHADKGWRCWWYVKILGIPENETWTVDVGDAPWATPDQASVSFDNGKNWQHTHPGTRKEKRIRYRVTGTGKPILLAWGPPFTPEDSANLVNRLAAGNGQASAFSLCTTKESRETPALRVKSGEGKPLIWIHARQHAWESGSSWVGKGFAEWLLSDAPDAVAFRQETEVVFVPVMDIDNVFRGVGGKSQRPQDHNRDWTENPHWNAVTAAQKELRAAAEEGRLAAYIDLHNPGAGSRFPYFYVPPKDILTPRAHANQLRFLALVKEEMKAPLRFAGQTIESGSKYDPKAWKAISKNWVALLGTDAISVTLETAWNTSASTTDGYEAVGRQLGQALARHQKEQK